jgi:hypothetical protein
LWKTNAGKNINIPDRYRDTRQWRDPPTGDARGGIEFTDIVTKNETSYLALLYR